jgi:hypothetical protein
VDRERGGPPRPTPAPTGVSRVRRKSVRIASLFSLFLSLLFSTVLAILDMPLVDVGAPIRPHVGADHPASGADHPPAERSHRNLVRQPICIHGSAVMTVPRTAVDEQVTAAVRANVPHGHRRECLVFAGHRPRCDRHAGCCLGRSRTSMNPRRRGGSPSRRAISFHYLTPRRWGWLEQLRPVSRQ